MRSVSLHYIPQRPTAGEKSNDSFSIAPEFSNFGFDISVFDVNIFRT